MIEFFDANGQCNFNTQLMVIRNSQFIGALRIAAVCAWQLSLLLLSRVVEGKAFLLCKHEFLEKKE